MVSSTNSDTGTDRVTATTGRVWGSSSAQQACLCRPFQPPRPNPQASTHVLPIPSASPVWECPVNGRGKSTKFSTVWTLPRFSCESFDFISILFFFQNSAKCHFPRKGSLTSAYCHQADLDISSLGSHNCANFLSSSFKLYEAPSFLGSEMMPYSNLFSSCLSYTYLCKYVRIIVIY